jgi:4-hydroxy-3-methylbut-2-enyl diphosphate reductase
VQSDLLISAATRPEVWALRAGARSARVQGVGMGADRARAAAARIVRDPASVLAIAGLCGALDDSLSPGDVVVAGSVASDDVQLPLESATRLCAALAEHGVSAQTVHLHSVDHIVRGSERERRSRAGARVVDMESAWLAAGAAGRPLAILRVVSDSPRHELGGLASAGHVLRALWHLRSIAPALELWAKRTGPVEPGR